MEKEKKKKEVCCVQSKTPMGAFNRNRHTCTSNDGVWVVVVVVVVKKKFFFCGLVNKKKNGNDLQRAQVKQLLWYVFPRAVTTSPSTNSPQ